MNNRRVLCRRRFDWFAIGYTIFLISALYWFLAYFDDSPFRVPVFWLFVAVVVAGQGVYLLVSWKSPNQLDLDRDDLVVVWRHPQREIRVPRHHVRIDKSRHFTSGYRLWCGAEKVLVFFPRVSIQQLMKSIHEGQSDFG